MISLLIIQIKLRFKKLKIIHENISLKAVSWKNGDEAPCLLPIPLAISILPASPALALFYQSCLHFKACTANVS